MTADITKNSAEDVWDMLDQFWLADDMKAVVCKAIARLPLDVQDFAIFNCTFIDFGGKEQGSTWPASIFTHLDRGGRTMRNHFLIILNRAISKDEEDAQFTIAHEIGHAWLKHPVVSSTLLKEVEADTLVESWGFVVPKYRLKVHAEYRRAMKRSGTYASQARANALTKPAAKKAAKKRG